MIVIFTAHFFGSIKSSSLKIANVNLRRIAIKSIKSAVRNLFGFKWSVVTNILKFRVGISDFDFGNLCLIRHCSHFLVSQLAVKHGIHATAPFHY